MLFGQKTRKYGSGIMTFYVTEYMLALNSWGQLLFKLKCLFVVSCLYPHCGRIAFTIYPSNHCHWDLKQRKEQRGNLPLGILVAVTAVYEKNFLILQRFLSCCLYSTVSKVKSPQWHRDKKNDCIQNKKSLGVNYSLNKKTCQVIVCHSKFTVVDCI